MVPSGTCVTHVPAAVNVSHRIRHLGGRMHAGGRERVGLGPGLLHSVGLGKKRVTCCTAQRLWLNAGHGMDYKTEWTVRT